MSKSLKLKINPVWEELDYVREQVEIFLAKHNFNSDQIHALMMTTSELAENAIKYGHYETDKDKIDIFLDIYPKEVIIEVKNKIHDVDNEELKELDENIQWIRGYQNQYEAYMEKLKHVSAKNLKKGESGLGLVRIAYEGQCILDFYVNEDDVLAMSAVYKLAG
ncbi:MAG: ATP-binding protein [Spirochaetia bacterium]|nr:ATP-binding protein [Spirochaetia bacterium]